MRRRTLFGRLLAVAAAFVVAPAVKAEAVPAETTCCAPGDTTCPMHAVTSGTSGYQRIVATGAEPWKHPERWQTVGFYGASPIPVPLTFEAMQADCAAQHHMLWSMDFEGGRQRVWHDDFSIEIGVGTELARVDAWRRSLHEAYR